jgi:hypothetical protein
MLDADGSHNPAELTRFVQALEDGAQFVKGSRHLEGGGSKDWTHVRRAGNRGFVWLVNHLYGCKFTDLCYGYCAFWRHHVEALALTATGFEIETQLILNAVKAGLRIHEVPSYERARTAGVSNLRAFPDGRRVLSTIINQRPGQRSPAASDPTEISLVPVMLPTPGSASWVPAGMDRRTGRDRRVLDRAASGYTGPERRRGERRRQPHKTVVVYRVVERPVEELDEVAALTA